MKVSYTQALPRKPMTAVLFPDTNKTQISATKRSYKSAWTTLTTVVWTLNATRQVLAGLPCGSGVALLWWYQLWTSFCSCVARDTFTRAFSVQSATVFAEPAACLEFQWLLWCKGSNHPADCAHSTSPQSTTRVNFNSMRVAVPTKMKLDFSSSLALLSSSLCAPSARAVTSASWILLLAKQRRKRRRINKNGRRCKCNNRCIQALPWAPQSITTNSISSSPVWCNQEAWCSQVCNSPAKWWWFLWLMQMASKSMTRTDNHCIRKQWCLNSNTVKKSRRCNMIRRSKINLSENMTREISKILILLKYYTLFTS